VRCAPKMKGRLTQQISDCSQTILDRYKAHQGSTAALATESGKDGVSCVSEHGYTWGFTTYILNAG
jgi:hypothetical protein